MCCFHQTFWICWEEPGVKRIHWAQSSQDLRGDSGSLDETEVSSGILLEKAQENIEDSQGNITSCWNEVGTIGTKDEEVIAQMDKGSMVADSFRSEQECCAALALAWKHANEGKGNYYEVTSLATPEANLPFQVHCDASDYGVGCCLTQQDTDGVYRPIAFASQKFTATQKNWGYTFTLRSPLARFFFFGDKHFNMATPHPTQQEIAVRQVITVTLLVNGI
ncbi:uncharacterized protein TNCT_159911 [Trichonephila clavata]|uniref:Reverse transcriptase/retrotransposon-derived protein RNase H-like domain-containing protein n=1 Tax=Trichonephila clavata TaxID=2740835 RepID=A0A8X6F455_TRICU|nr:uncharacterized protein TNCT_159911 [Trichonephila clavata]